MAGLVASAILIVLIFLAPSNISEKDSLIEHYIEVIARKGTPSTWPSDSCENVLNRTLDSARLYRQTGTEWDPF